MDLYCSDLPEDGRGVSPFEPGQIDRPQAFPRKVAERCSLNSLDIKGRIMCNAYLSSPLIRHGRLKQ